MRKVLVAFGLLVVVILGISAFYSHKSSNSPGSKIQVVAAENFWGSLITQLGGNKVNVVSIVSDPNADPHEYESNSTDARDIATAKYVIINGVGYDSWADKLLSASPNPS